MSRLNSALFCSAELGLARQSWMRLGRAQLGQTEPSSAMPHRAKLRYAELDFTELISVELGFSELARPSSELGRAELDLTKLGLVEFESPTSAEHVGSARLDSSELRRVKLRVELGCCQPCSAGCHLFKQSRASFINESYDNYNLKFFVRLSYENFWNGTIQKARVRCD